MPTKKEILESKNKDKLFKIAKKAKIEVKKSMKKPELVEKIEKSRKIKKSDL